MKRYLILLAIFVILVVSRRSGFYVSEKIISGSSDIDGSSSLEKPEISKTGYIYRRAITAHDGEYTRFSFWVKSISSCHSEAISISTVSRMGEKSRLVDIQLDGQSNYHYFEEITQAKGDLENLVFEKVEPECVANVYIRGIRAERLNTRDQGEIAALKNTLTADIVGKDLLPGAVIEDIGGGRGYYTYEALDLTLDDRNVTVSEGADTKETAYRIYTIYPIDRMLISVKSPDKTVKVYYSLDNQDWKQLKTEVEAPGEERRTEEIVMGGGNNLIYVKVVNAKKESSEVKFMGELAPR